MSARARIAQLPAAVLLAAVLAVPAAAGDEEPSDAPRGREIAPGRRIEGEVRAGLRLLSGEGEGRFPQDEGLKDGLRLFDMYFLYSDDREEASIDEIEASAYGVGDPSSDYLVTLRRFGLFEVEGGFRRDDYSYRATGDPFPYDTIRERMFARGRFTPRNDLALRFAFDRTTRKGDAYTSADSVQRELPPPPGVDDDIVRDRRPLDQTFDTWLVGVDGGRGIWRYGFSQTIHYDVIDDERTYDVPPDKRGADPVREVFDRTARNKAYTTTAKVGVSPFRDRSLDLNLIWSYTHAPTDSDLGADAQGFDNAFTGGTPNGAFTSRLDGGSSVRRSVVTWRAEALWNVEPVEFTAAAELYDTVDDASLDLTERRVYDRLDVPTSTTRRSVDARITDRTERYSGDAVWQIHETVRLRGGQEYFRQELEDPTNTRGRTFNPTDLHSTTWRTTTGVDWEPTDRVDLGFLYRWSNNDEPYSAVSPHDATEASFRGRWKPTDQLFFTGVWRLKDYEHDRQFDSDTSSQIASLAVTWKPGKFSCSVDTAYQVFDTHTGTRFFVLDGAGLRQTEDTVRFRSRDLTTFWEASYEWTSTLRTFANSTFNRTTGDYHARYHEATLGAEYDLRDDVTVGLAARLWDFNEKGRDVDDYDTTALEFWITYRF